MVAGASAAAPIESGAPAGPTITEPTQAVAASVSRGGYSVLPPVENKELMEGKSFLVSNNYHTDKFDWIIDSGATDHMTYSEKDLVKRDRKSVV